MEEKKLIDEAFYVVESRWKTWKSFDKEDKPLITALTEEALINATRWYLKQKQEGFEETKTYDSVVGGKL